MPEVLALIEFDGDPRPDWQPASDERLIGGSVWTGLGATSTSLVLLRFADDAAGQAHLRARIESETDIEHAPMPRSVRHVAVESHHGRSLDSLAAGAYLSVFHVVTSPGYGGEMGRRIEETLEGIEAVEGYAGDVRGTNAALPDEVCVLVLWSAPPVLALPSDPANVAHYRRVR